MDTSDWEDEAETAVNDDSLLAWAKEYLSEKYANAPKSFLEAYRDAYDKAKAEIFALPPQEFKARIGVLSDYFYEFLSLDYQKILFGLIEKKSAVIFDFVLFLHEKAILPQNCAEDAAFRAYQDLIEDKCVLNEMQQKLNGRLKIRNTQSDSWEKLSDADCYVLKIDCAAYVRQPCGNERNTLDVASGAVKLNGLEYKSPLPFDEIVYVEA